MKADKLETSLPTLIPNEGFTDEELEGLPEPVARYLRVAIAPGTPLVPAANLKMRGSIKLGSRWLPFRAHQQLAPHGGSVWSARVAGIVSGADRYAGGRGSMRWKLFGLIPIVRAEGADLSRSSAGRFGAEAIWVPTSLMPRFGVSWRADDDSHIAASFRKDDVQLDLRIALENNGRMRSVHLDRWGDAESNGTYDLVPFGVDVTGYGTFGGLTIPLAGRGGWFHDTDRWSEGEFFRYEITDLELLGAGQGETVVRRN